MIISNIHLQVGPHFVDKRRYLNYLDVGAFKNGAFR